jgi:dipicolinate synthase subunit A
VGSLKHRFAVIGGDKRNVYLFKLLEEDGHTVNKYGFGGYALEQIDECENLYDALIGVDYIIGPTPCSHNGEVLNAVYSRTPILIDDIFRLIKPAQTFFGGHIKEDVYACAKRFGVNCADMLKWEELALLNAIPTAEGAIKIAMENTDFTLHNSNVMVVGYGRVGKVLCKMLNGMGARVFPVVRMRFEAAEARSYGYSPILHENMDVELNGMDVIFNTVPQILFDKNNIKFINKKCLFIDIASAPHGINSHFAKETGLNVLFAGSLPGTVAPKTAAKYILETVYAYLEGGVVNER